MLSSKIDRRRHGALAIVLVASCASCPKCPKPVPPPPVTVIAEPLVCDLPALPESLAKAVGYPSPDGKSIYITVTDYAALGSYVLGLHQWITAASACIVSPPRESPAP